MKISSVKQEFSVKEELTIMQLESLSDILEKHSAEFKSWQGQSQELSEKLADLQNEKDKEIATYYKK